MAKGKKSKKDVISDAELSSDEVEDVDDTKPKAKAKNKKKDTELEDDMESLNIDDNKKKDSKKSAQGKADDDSEEEEDVPVKPKKGGFALLMDDGGDSLPSDQSEEEEIVKPVPKKKEKNEKKKKKKATKEEEEEVDELQMDEAPKEEKGGKKKKKGKKGKKGGEDDEDLDAMLAALRAEYDGGEAAPEPAKNEEKPDEKKGKKGKGKKKEESPIEDGFEIIEKEDTELSEKALKKKEKRERQKLKEKETTPSDDKEPATAEKVAEAPEDGGEDNEPEESGKKGKKKKGKKEEEDKKKKKPNKAVLAAMQEALAKQKEEDEKRQREEEEKERLAEEAFQAKLKAKELEEEKKRLKKEKEKLKKEELKKQGLLLSKAEREKKARAEAMLAAMRAQGVDVPAIGEKRPKPGTRKRMNQKMRHHQPEPEAPKVEEEVKSVSDKVEEKPKEESKVEDGKEDIADSWDAEDDVKDAWDADSDGEQDKKPAEEKPVVKEETPVTEDNEEDEDDDEEENSEEESEDEDESEDESDEESSSEEEEEKTEDTRERAIHRIRNRIARNEAARSTDVLRAPVVCVLGHVDVGKTKILDKLRKTNVQDGEAGGITQQIGATNVPIHVIQEQCKMVKGFGGSPLKLPGLLIIDTPGHESFSNLRDRGSSLCDIAVLVIDIMHGLEPQTIESLNMLKKKKVPFIVALNKVDRLYEWKSNRHKDIRDVIDSQPNNTKMEFFKRKDEVILGLAEQGMNASLFYENPDPEDYISLGEWSLVMYLIRSNVMTSVPTSAHSGDGMGNLMASIVQHSQNCLSKRLSYTEELQCTILEVKAIGGFGTTIDVCLVNGRLKFGQTIVLPGTEGPIVTTVRVSQGGGE